jgi:uncharacterized membrane protein YdjX (TVP38/TMEM64 family)
VTDLSCILGALSDALRHPLLALRENRDAMMAFARHDRALAMAVFFAVDVGLLGLTLPLNIPFALAAGLMFGWAEGTALSALATASGATISCLSSRLLLKGWLRHRLGRRLREIEDGLERHGAMHLLTLRLTPLAPYTLVNLLFGLTDMGLARFFAITLIGALPATAAYVNAGAAFQILDDIGDILDWRMIAALTLLAGAPILISRLHRVDWPRRQ